jgi:hypothetical protein
MAKKKPKVVGGGLSAAEIARLCDMSISRVYAELAQGRSAFEVIATAQRRQQKAAREASVLPLDVDVVAPLVNGGTHVNGVPSYSESLAKKESMLADLRHVELMQKRGELMPVSYARLWGVRFLVAAKDELLRGPGELQDVLAAESDPLKCAAIVRSWTERCLNRFCELEKLWGPPLDDEAA